MYDTALWQSFSAKSINRLRSCYYKCMKHLFSGYTLGVTVFAVCYLNSTCQVLTLC